MEAVMGKMEAAMGAVMARGLFWIFWILLPFMVALILMWALFILALGPSTCRDSVHVSTWGDSSLCSPGASATITREGSTVITTCTCPGRK